VRNPGIQTQNVSSISNHFYIKAVAVMKMKKEEIYAASGVWLGQMAYLLKGYPSIFLASSGTQRLLITFY
jgi:hypothetical protein